MPSTRVCDLCGRPYYRRSLTETWDRQAPGSRVGWHKAIIRACTDCVDQKKAQKVMLVATVRIVSHDAPKRVQSRTRAFLTALRRAQAQGGRRDLRREKLA